MLVAVTLSRWSVSAQTSQSNKVSYQGQPVATVELVANPKISMESLRGLVRQRAGEPYSDAQVQETVSGLQGTGRFSRVEVDVKPDSGGLHLIFTLQPALYFGILEFTGASKNFSYTRLLQVVDIPNRTPYREDVLSKARDSLQQFFVSAGYFEAQVEPEAQFDESHMLANVVFHIDLEKRAKLGEVKITGTEPDETERLLRASRSFRATATGASLKPGKPYTPKRINSGIALMKRKLASEHHLASKVQLGHPRYHADTHRADILIDVRLGPIVRVRLTGAKLSPLPFLRERQMKN